MFRMDEGRFYGAICGYTMWDIYIRWVKHIIMAADGLTTTAMSHAPVGKHYAPQFLISHAMIFILLKDPRNSNIYVGIYFK